MALVGVEYSYRTPYDAHGSDCHLLPNTQIRRNGTIELQIYRNDGNHILT
jgi:phosphate-selective porin